MDKRAKTALNTVRTSGYEGRDLTLPLERRNTMNFVHFDDGECINLDNVAHIEQVRNNDDHLHGIIVSWLGAGAEFAHTFFEREKAKRILSYIARHTVID